MRLKFALKKPKESESKNECANFTENTCSDNLHAYNLADFQQCYNCGTV